MDVAPAHGSETTVRLVSSLLVSVFAGAIGMAYFVYGKRQSKFVPMLGGILLCVYPYFFENILWLSVIGLALVAAPFLIDL